MRVGTDKRSVGKAAAEKALSRAVRQKNVGSPAYDVTDPIQRLMFTIGSGYFGEDKFYDSKQPANGNGHRVSKARVSSYKGKTLVRPDNVKNSLGLNETAQELIATMEEIAKDPEQFEDLMVLARWAREDLNLRQTPLMALAVLAKVESDMKRGSGVVRKYAPKILRRADEPKRAFAAYRHLYMQGQDGTRKGTLPRNFARGLIAALQRFNEYQILKYDSQRERPTFKDLAILLSKYEGRGKGRASRKNMRPFSDAMAKYLITGEADADELPKASARSELSKRKNWDAKSKELAKTADVTWEYLISQFGSRKETWGWLVENRQLPYMAALRNLRKLDEVGISRDQWKSVYKLLTGDYNHRQMPYRFLAARNEVKNQTAISAIDVALDKSVKNVPDLPGRTFIMVDLSASMNSGVSGKSKMSCRDAGISMCGILAKKYGVDAIVGGFGESFARVAFSEADSTMSIIKQIDNLQVGHATHAYLALKWLLARRDGRIKTGIPRKGPVMVDRIIVVSDMNCYSRNGWGGENVAPLLAEYRSTVNPNVYYYSVNVGGGSQAQMDPQGNRTLLMSGFSEKLFALMAGFEAGEATSGDSESAVMPTIQELREKFSV